MISTCLCFCFFSVAKGQQEKAIVELLRPIVSEIAASPNVGGWTWETNGNGGYLIRKLMDVTGDGRPELFVASTLQSSRNAHVWQVFDVTDNGDFHPYNTTLNSISGTPRTENGHHSLNLFPFADQERLRISHEKPYCVVHYSFSYPTINKTTSYLSEADAMRLQPHDMSQLPKLQVILLADYLTKPNAEWTDVTEMGVDANDCFFLPDDKERAIKNTSFTPHEAIRLLGVDHRKKLREKRRPDLPASVQFDSAGKERMLSADRQSLTESGSFGQWPWVAFAVFVIASVFSWLRWFR